MKTTAGKSKTRRLPRAMYILYAGAVGNDERLREPDVLAVVSAESLRQALEDWYDVKLQHDGFSDPLFNGNTLLVRKADQDHRFIAREVS